MTPTKVYDEMQEANTTSSSDDTAIPDAEAISAAWAQAVRLLFPQRRAAKITKLQSIVIFALAQQSTVKDNITVEDCRAILFESEALAPVIRAVQSPIISNHLKVRRVQPPERPAVCQLAPSPPPSPTQPPAHPLPCTDPIVKSTMSVIQKPSPPRSSPLHDVGLATPIPLAVQERRVHRPNPLGVQEGRVARVRKGLRPTYRAP